MTSIASETKEEAIQLTVAGYATCSYFQKAANTVVALETLHPTKFKARILEFENKTSIRFASS